MTEVSVLTENTCPGDRFRHEHGLSLLIECNGKRILFDSGQSEVFLENSRLMGKDIGSVDIFILSHGHFDHGGGILLFLEENKKAPLYMKKEALGNHFARRPDFYEYIGLPEELSGEERIRFTGEEEKIDENTFLFSGLPEDIERPRSNEGLFIKGSDGNLVPDTFRHEQNLLVKDSETGKSLLITGCSHNGILNIMNFYRNRYRSYPDAVIGGFHLASRSGGNADKREITEIGKNLLETGSVFYTGHCTGEEPFKLLKEIMGEKIHRIHAGYTCVL